MRVVEAGHFTPCRIAMHKAPWQGGPGRDAGAGPGGRAGPGGMAGGGSRAPALGAASHGPHFAHSQGAAAISRKVHGPGAPAGGGRPPPAVRIARFPPTLDPRIMNERIAHAGLASRLMSAEQAAALIQPGMAVGMSGFTGAGYPKAVPKALASRIEAAHGRGEQFAIRILTGASTAPELDGVLARAGGIEFRLPYQSDPELRGR